MLGFRFGKTFASALLVGLSSWLLGISAGPVRAATLNLPEQQRSPAEIANDVVSAVVQGAIQNARDRIFDQQRQNTTTGRPLGFSGPPIADETFGPFNALGYVSNPMATKAPGSSSTPSSSLSAALWASGTESYERVTGVAPSSTHTASGLGGVDFAISNVAPYSGTFLFGFFGGDSVSNSASSLVFIGISLGGVSTRVTSPTVGAYAAYIVGGFSTDFAFTTNFAQSSVSALGSPLPISNQTSHNYAWNLQYRISEGSAWFEPTAGVSYTNLVQNFDPITGTVDTSNEDTLRIQGGARAGMHVMLSGGMSVEPTLTGLVYSDTFIAGGSIGGITPTLTDAGKVWGKGDGKLNFVFSQNFSAYIEGEFHGTSNETGYSGSVGARWAF